MNVNGNLQNGIGIQMGQIKAIEIKDRVGAELQKDREDLKAGKQELGHGKQKRLKAQYIWDIPESDTVSKSAQSAPNSYFLKTPASHVVTRRLLLKPRWATSSLGYYPQSGQRSLLSLGVTSKTPTSSLSRSALPLKC